MKTKMENEVRHGRPCGGTGFLWAKELSGSIKPKPEYDHERVTVMEVRSSIGSLLVINVYLPYFNASDLSNQLNLYSHLLKQLLVITHTLRRF